MISSTFLASNKPFSWAFWSLSPPQNTLLNYIPLINHVLQDRAQLVLSVVPPRVGRMVTSPTTHFSGTGQTICPDISPLANFFSAGRVVCLGTNLSAHYFSSRWIAQPDASRSDAHVFDTGYKEAGCPFCHLSSGHISSKAVDPATKPLYASSQVVEPA